MQLAPVIALALALGGSAACASRQPTPSIPVSRAESASKASPLCQGLLGHFIGLPAELADAGSAGAPAAGRWWVKSCAFELAGAELHLRLRGPGWFWVDRREGPLHLRQHVYFRVDADLCGSVQKHIGWRNGLVSVWFKPSRAVVHAVPIGRVHANSNSVVVSVMRRLAGLGVDEKVRHKVEQEITRRFEEALGRGYTVVYDLENSQSEFAIGALGEGTRPKHPFIGGGGWYVNENVIAAPGGVHAFGPFEPREALSLDARISSGLGVNWRAICASEVERAFSKVESGETASIPERAVLKGGTLSGSGIRHSKTPVLDCPSYIVVSAIGNDVTRAALRVRPL